LSVTVRHLSSRNLSTDISASPISATHAVPRKVASTPVALVPQIAENASHQTAVVCPDMQHEVVDPQTPIIYSFFEKVTGTWQYILMDPRTSDAVIIDPVLDYDPASGTISTQSADRLLSFIRQQSLTVSHVLYVFRPPIMNARIDTSISETHAHQITLLHLSI
jgi:hypothetical protein